ncbi:MAG: 4a-hydroxytetrahydrobiopterin dehydratase [Acidobacteriota bacterium]
MKPERIQSEFNVPGEAANAVQDFLEDHGAWRLTGGGNRLVREYHFPTARSAAAFAHFGAEVADAFDHLCAIELRGDSLRIIIGAGSVLIPKDLELAAALAGVD